MADHGLGRLPAPDPRDDLYLVRRLLATAQPALPVRRYWWPSGWWGDQGATSSCVGYAWSHWLKAGPTTQRGYVPDPAGVYRRAQQVDEWEGEGYDGTSVRAGAKILQADGLIDSYYWARTGEQVAAAVLGFGPVVVGTDWHQAMFAPAKADGWRLRLGGPVVGGHAYLLDGYNADTGLFRVKQSWGRLWGNRGFAALYVDDLDQLLGVAGGEACLAVETDPTP